MANVWTCSGCERDNTARVKRCVHCGESRPARPAVRSAGPSLRAGCSWTTQERRCLMPAEVELEGRRLCGWHHHTLGDPRLGHEAFGEWLTWLARSRTCSIWRHLPESELSDLMAGDEPFPGTEPGYCGEPGCPYEPNPSGVDGRIALETIKGFLEDFNSWERKERLREQPGILERAGVHPLRSATWIAIAREPNLAEKWGLKGRKR